MRLQCFYVHASLFMCRTLCRCSRPRCNTVFARCCSGGHLRAVDFLIQSSAALYSFDQSIYMKSRLVRSQRVEKTGTQCCLAIIVHGPAVTPQREGQRLIGSRLLNLTRHSQSRLDQLVKHTTVCSSQPGRSRSLIKVCRFGRAPFVHVRIWQLLWTERGLFGSQCCHSARPAIMMGHHSGVPEWRTQASRQHMLHRGGPGSRRTVHPGANSGRRRSLCPMAANCESRERPHGNATCL